MYSTAYSENVLGLRALFLVLVRNNVRGWEALHGLNKPKLCIVQDGKFRAWMIYGMVIVGCGIYVMRMGKAGEASVTIF